MMLMTLACQAGTRSDGFRGSAPPAWLTGPRCPGAFIELSGRAIQEWSPSTPLAAFTVRLTQEEISAAASPPGPGSAHQPGRTLTRRRVGLLTIALRLAKKSAASAVSPGRNETTRSQHRPHPCHCTQSHKPNAPAQQVPFG